MSLLVVIGGPAVRKCDAWRKALAGVHARLEVANAWT